MADARVGGEVDSFCTKCRMLLAHVVLAMVGSKIARVRCNTCMGEHAYRNAGPSEPKARNRSAAAAREREQPKVLAFDTLIADRDLSSAKHYDPKAEFVVHDLLQHPAFGLGVVTTLRGADKMDVLFKSTAKTLARNRANKPATLSHVSPRVEELTEAEAAETEA